MKTFFILTLFLLSNSLWGSQHEQEPLFIPAAQEEAFQAAWASRELIESNNPDDNQRAFTNLACVSYTLAMMYKHQVKVPVPGVIKKSLDFLLQKDPANYQPMYQRAFWESQHKNINNNIDIYLKYKKWLEQHKNQIHSGDKYTPSSWNMKLVKFEAAFSIFSLPTLLGDALDMNNKAAIDEMNAYCANEIEVLFSSQVPFSPIGLFMDQMQIMMELDPFDSKGYKKMVTDHLFKILNGAVSAPSDMTKDELKIKAAARLFHAGFALHSYRRIIEMIESTTTQGYIREIAQNLLKKMN